MKLYRISTREYLMADFFYTSEVDGVLVVAVAEPNPMETLFDKEAADELTRIMQAFRPERVVVDFGYIHWCPTTAIFALLAIPKYLAPTGRMKLCGVSDAAHVACRFLNLDSTTLDIAESRTEALAAFQDHETLVTA